MVLDAAAPTMLARCRRSGTVCNLTLNELASRSEAGAFQAAAIEALGGEACGYKIGATSVEVQRLLSCTEPIYAPIPREYVLPSAAVFRIPDGLLGVECEFGFLMSRDYPASGEATEMATLRSAVAGCFMALELVGRRVSADVPLNEASSIADYALNVAVVRGAPIADWESRDLAMTPVRAMLDGVIAASGTGAMALDHPVKALLWLARKLHRRGARLRGGEIVLTGTCTGITRVAPGQMFEGCFADLSPVQLRLG
ncbi:MAG TPA: fumarylacetoacetate hydrolase family protein [Stellaceae bacterium]|nr:fumarylacetoacetate hydrolase family protein [Stellaceae bacterium]